MTNEQFIPFAEIVAELKSVCAEKKTGVMYITSEENQSAQLMLDDGEIVFIYFFNKRGRDALRPLAEIDAGRFRFQEGGGSSLRTELPRTEDILRYLSAASGLDPVSGADSESVNGGKIAGDKKNGVMLTQEQKRVLEDRLAGYIGPMAAIVCEDHFDSAGGIESVINLLAAEIPAESQAESFRSEMMSKLVG